MKYTRLLISMFALIVAASDSHAIKLCQLDWFQAWIDRGDSTQLASSTYAYTGSWTDGAPGTWSVTSTQGSGTVKHTVSGMARCSNSTSNATSLDASTASNSRYCWCRMTTPNLGASWVFHYDAVSAASCAANCAHNCAYCVQNGKSASCTRSAVLELP
ncbi:MAG: hypothetical protein LBL21_03970 [Rickettsiales bacterium]|nr:hypothetical protein [Rickettsiales bacterium]